jgi:hypothetical protein
LSAPAAPLATVTAASNGVNVTSYTGAGTLNVNTTSTLFNAIAPGTNTVRVKTSTGNAVLHYTAVTPTTLTGVSRISGTGTLATGNAVNLEKDVATLRGIDLTTTARAVTDTATTCTATTIKSVAAAFGPDDIGMNISGIGIAANAVITGVNTVTNTATIAGAVTTAPCPGTGGKFFFVGTPSVTAPKDNDTVLNIGIQADLNPLIIPGVNRCAENKPEGFGVAGVWANPGSPAFVTTGFSAPPAGNFATIGQIQFKTAALTYSAYIIQRPSGDPTKAGPHYDITFPSVPTSLGTCPGSPVGVSYSFTVIAVPNSQAMIPSGVGRPLTGQFRAIGPVASGTLSTTAIMKSDDPARPFTIPSTCVLNSTPAADFHCGNG